MDGDPTPALTGRRRTRPTSIGCRNPWQPKPGRAPLIAAQAAVQTNRATSVLSQHDRMDDTSAHLKSLLDRLKGAQHALIEDAARQPGLPSTAIIGSVRARATVPGQQG